jgi:hypothetical protein
MKTNILNRKDKVMLAAKRKRQALSRALVMSGSRSQESMFFIAPSIARSAVVQHRTFVFD